MKINYQFQKENNYLRISITKNLMKQKNQTKKINHDDSEFITDSKNIKTGFSRNKDLMPFLSEIKKVEITMERAKTSQENFNNYPKTMRRGNISEEQQKTLSHINRLFNGRNCFIKFVEDYGLVIYEAKRKAAEELTTGEGLKILTPKQMFQRLPKALAQVKAGSNSGSLLN